MHAYMYVNIQCIHIHMNMYVCTYIRTYRHCTSHTCYMYAYVYMYLDLYLFMYMYMYVHKYTLYAELRNVGRVPRDTQMHSMRSKLVDLGQIYLRSERFFPLGMYMYVRPCKAKKVSLSCLRPFCHTVEPLCSMLWTPLGQDNVS